MTYIYIFIFSYYLLGIVYFTYIYHNSKKYSKINTKYIINEDNDIINDENDILDRPENESDILYMQPIHQL